MVSGNAKEPPMEWSIAMQDATHRRRTLLVARRQGRPMRRAKQNATHRRHTLLVARGGRRG